MVSDKKIFIWANCNQTLVECSLDDLPKLCQVILTSNQDGHQAKNRKKGDEIKKKSKVWFQLSYWFQTRRFLCEFPIGYYVKLSSAVGAILIEGPNRWTHFWKRTKNQSQPNFAEMILGWSSSKIVSGISEH
jgi:hypothetical protein